MGYKFGFAPYSSSLLIEYKKVKLPSLMGKGLGMGQTIAILKLLPTK
jgi:hypothetical protein